LRPKTLHIIDRLLIKDDRVTGTDDCSNDLVKASPFTPTQAAKTLTSALGVLLGIATLLGFCLHLAGDVAHSTYLNKLGIQATLFPQAVDAKIIHGYYVTILQGVAVLSDVPWGILLAIISFSTLTVVLLRAPVDENPRLKAWLSQRSYWIRGSISAAAATVAFLSAVTALWYVILLIAIVPGFAAERHGKIRAEEMAKRLLDGNELAVSEVWKGEELIARGQVIASSQERIAIYDVALKTMRTLPASGIEIRTPVPGSTTSAKNERKPQIHSTRTPN
jgi:hypothetical protein